MCVCLLHRLHVWLFECSAVSLHGYLFMSVVVYSMVCLDGCCLRACYSCLRDCVLARLVSSFMCCVFTCVVVCLFARVCLRV